MSDLRDPLVIKWWTDGNGNKISIERTGEQNKIINGKMYLNEIPDEFHKITIAGYTELPFGSTISSDTEFICNYTTGQVTFDSSREGTTITSSYWSRGIISYPASRIYTETDENGDITETLKDLVDLTEGLPEAEALRVAAENDRVIAEDGRVAAEIVREEKIGELDHKGDYDNGTTYEENNMVTYNGSTYIATQQTQGNLPTDGTYWNLVAQRGVDGLGSVSSVNSIGPDGGGNVTLTKSNIDLGNVDNTSDSDKPVSTAQQAALNGKANTSHSHAISDVTSLQTSLDGKQATLVSGTNIKTVDGNSIVGSGNLNIENLVDQNTGTLKLWSGSQAQYDAIGTKDSSTIYLIV